MKNSWVIFLCLFLGGCSSTSLLSKVFPAPFKDDTKTSMHLSSQSKKYGNPHYKLGTCYTIKNVRYCPREKFSHVEEGLASWYGPMFHGKLTANGEIFNMYEVTGAHKTLQLPCMAKVTNLDNGRILFVRLNDRGPYYPGRIVDLSKRAAQLLGFHNRGKARVRLEVISHESKVLAAMAQGKTPPSGPDKFPLRMAESAPVVSEKPSFQLASNKQSGDIFRQGRAVLPNGREAPPEVQKAVKQVKEAVEDATKNIKEATSRVQEVVPKAKESVPQVREKSAPIQHAMPSERKVALPAKPVPTQAEGVYVQVGTFSKVENASRLSNKLSSLGSTKVNAVNSGDRTLYAVRAGPFKSKDVANTYLNKLKATGHSDAHVLK
ncbi:MAG: septal ring lytic transglycosylase RlpA family protein [Alphaproteobacteria bacterium]|jgi:rare lipoprotein A|nr:septal ring lytic transglycosylase RlpA family protein [Alphaproteobacteria bacterium]MBT5389810.1 septal ring lytic transglycosylase RlpA family protein [Alphaproteobacteria bacterium]MBT5540222.1 septal ring lytic transglycosylase RlpA family protein [Alphaproteobacteria bacterium]